MKKYHYNFCFYHYNVQMACTGAAACVYSKLISVCLPILHFSLILNEGKVRYIATGPVMQII